MDILPETEWESLIDKLKQKKGTAFLIGATDSGKSTITKYMVGKLIKENIRVSVVDTDIGQSTLGVPGTITMKIFYDEKDTEEYKFDKMFFVGSTNPAKKISIMIDGSRKMIDICRRKSDVIIVDTTGLISCEIGKALKIGKISAIIPEHIIAIQKSSELEHIINYIEGIPVYRIKTSIMAKSRDRDVRLHYRIKKFLDYFNEKETFEFILNHTDVRFFYNNKQLILRKGDFKKGTIIGLNHNDDTIGLGVIIDIDDEGVFFKSPIKSLKKINRILFSDIMI